MPPEVLSVSALICQTSLLEQDGVSSAIRIVDVFYVSEAPNAKVAFSAIVLVKSKAGFSSERRARARIRTPSSHTIELTPEGVPVRLQSRLGDPSIPGGATLTFQVVLEAEEMGVYWLKVFLDDDEVANLPFALKRPEPPTERAPEH